MIFIARDPMPSIASSLSLIRNAHARIYGDAWRALSAVDQAWMLHRMAHGRAGAIPSLLRALRRFARQSPPEEGRSGCVRVVRFESVTGLESVAAIEDSLLPHLNLTSVAANEVRATFAAAARTPYSRTHRVESLEELGVQDSAGEIDAAFRSFRDYVARVV